MLEGRPVCTSHNCPTARYLLPRQSLPQRLVLPPEPLVLPLRLLQLGLQALQVLLLLLARLTCRLPVLNHALLPLQHLHLSRGEALTLPRIQGGMCTDINAVQIQTDTERETYVDVVGAVPWQRRGGNDGLGSRGGRRPGAVGNAG